MTISEQMKNNDRQLIIDVLQAVLDNSMDLTKIQMQELIKHQINMLERRKS